MKLTLLSVLLVAFSVLTYGKPISKNHSNENITELQSKKYVQTKASNSNDIQRVRLRFMAEDGLIRPLLLGFTPDDAASDGIDYGYDAYVRERCPNDMFWDIDHLDFMIQGVGAFDATKMYPFHMDITNPGLIQIALTELENFDSEIDVFIYDSLLNSYTRINNAPFQATLNSDCYQARFYIAFAASQSLSIFDIENEPIAQINYLMKSNEIFIKANETFKIQKVNLFNSIGESVLTWKQQDLKVDSAQNTRLLITSDKIQSGSYIIQVVTDHFTRHKKIVIIN